MPVEDLLLAGRRTRFPRLLKDLIVMFLTLRKIRTRILRLQNLDLRSKLRLKKMLGKEREKRKKAGPKPFKPVRSQLKDSLPWKLTEEKRMTLLQEFQIPKII
jgi:hypothetical protein